MQQTIKAKLPEVSVNIPTIGSQFSQLSPDTSYMKRSFHQKTEKIINDTFGLFWIIGRLTAQSKSLIVKTPDKKIEIPPETIIYVPPFNMLEWHLPIGHIEFEVISTIATQDKTPYTHPLAFFGIDSNYPMNDFSQFSKHLNGKKNISIGRECTNCSLSKRVKEFLDKNYADDISLEELAIMHKTSSSVLARYFRSCYGVPPIQYLKRLRLAEAMLRLFVSNTPVVETAAEVGFPGVRNFRQQFNNWLGVPPSHFHKESLTTKTK